MGFSKKDVTASVTKKLRLTPADTSKIEESASRAGLSFSEYVRRCCLGRRIEMRYDVDAILALRDVAIEIRALRSDPRTHLPDEEVMDALQEAVDAIKRV
jgi:hypothetical protein